VIQIPPDIILSCWKCYCPISRHISSQYNTLYDTCIQSFHDLWNNISYSNL